MTVSSGYVHISLRNAQNRAGIQRQAYGQRPGIPSYSQPAAAAYSPAYGQLQSVPSPAESVQPITAPVPVVTPNGIPGPQAVTGDTTARGFVLYVALDEDTAAEHDTTLSKLAQ